MSDLLNIEKFYGRSLDTIYTSAKIEEAPDGENFRCSVCHKEYKTKHGAEKHLDKRSCHTALSVFKDTEFENTMYKVYKYITRSQGSSLFGLRSSKIYRQLAIFTGYLLNNLRHDMIERYIIYITNYYTLPALATKKFYYVKTIGMKDSTLVAFREHLLKYQNIIPTPDNDLVAQLSDDPQALIRALERCDVSLDDADRYIDIDVMVGKMTESQKIRLEQVCYQVEYANM